MILDNEKERDAFNVQINCVEYIIAKKYTWISLN